MRKSKEETVGKINGVMAHELDYDLSIWGASTASVNFNPKIIIDSLGVDAMNMGIIGTNIDQYAGLLMEYLSYTENSETVIISLDIHGGLGDRKSFYHMHNWLHHIDKANIHRCFSDIDFATVAKLRFVPFYKLTHFDKHAFPYFRRALLNPSTEYRITDYGFQPKPKGPGEAKEHTKPFKTDIDDRSFEKLKDLVTTMDQKGIRCYIVVTPCFEDGLALIENASEFVAKLKTLNTANVSLLDLSDCYISKEPKFFTDNTHLSPLGANELTRHLLREIQD